MSLLSNPSLGRIGRLAGVTILLTAVVLMGVVVFPQLIGAEQSYVVISGSMSPTIKAGDVVVVRDTPANAIEEGDVITFETTDSRPSRITHRVVEVVRTDGELQFRTKGDANEEPDPKLVPANRLIGQVWFHIPYLGYLLTFAQSKMGILTLVVVPLVLLVVTEVYSLAKAAMDDPNDDDGVGTESTVKELEAESTEGSQG
ncbi:signal peptidase I [Haladaptatus sp. NG-SE-30]